MYSKKQLNPSIWLVIIVLGLLVQVQLSKVECQVGNNPRQKNSFQLTQRELLVDTIYPKVDLIVDSLDWTVSASIMNVGTWEGHNLRTMGRFIKEGDTVLNVGSHVGLEAVVLGKVVGDKGKLFVFEPYSLSYNMMLKNIYLNGLAPITRAYNVAGGNQVSKGHISVVTANTGGSQIFTNKTIKSAPVQTEEVKVDLVDSVLPSGTVVNFALIDVERMEIECLDGMKETIKNSPNIIIMCEWSGYSFNTKDFPLKKNQLLTWFEELNFKFYGLERQEGCQNMRFNPLSKQDVMKIQDHRIMIDILFVPGHIEPNTLE